MPLIVNDYTVEQYNREAKPCDEVLACENSVFRAL